MKKNHFLSKNSIFKKLDTNELKKINIHKDNKNINIIKNLLNDSTEENIKMIYKDLKLKSFNDKTLTKKPNNKNRKSNLISLTKSTNYFKAKNKTYKCSKDVKLMTDSGNINFNFNSYIINTKNANANSKNKNRYLTCFENIENNNSIKTDENKINNLLNDFIVPNTSTNTEGNITESKNKENININLNEEKKEKDNNDNFLIKVNKKKPVNTANNHPKNFYIQACLKLKEKLENNDKSKTEIKTFKESNRNNFLKISKINSERKRNSSNFIKINHYKQNFCGDKGNNINKKPRTGYSIATIYKPYNSFRVNEKKLFLNNNYLKKQMTKPLILDTFKENKKSKNKSCFEKEDITKMHLALSLEGLFTEYLPTNRPNLSTFAFYKEAVEILEDNGIIKTLID
jgi:ribulose bisphosphate carboxylase small subunit